MHVVHPLGCRSTDEGTDDRLRKTSVKRKVHLRYAGGSSKKPFILRGVSAKGSDIVKRSSFASHDPIAADEVRIDRIGVFALEHRLVQPRRQCVDQIDVAGEFTVFLAGNAPETKMPK